MYPTHPKFYLLTWFKDGFWDRNGCHCPVSGYSINKISLLSSDGNWFCKWQRKIRGNWFPSKCGCIVDIMQYCQMHSLWHILSNTLLILSPILYVSQGVEIFTNMFKRYVLMCHRYWIISPSHKVLKCRSFGFFFKNVDMTYSFEYTHGTIVWNYVSGAKWYAAYHDCKYIYMQLSYLALAEWYWHSVLGQIILMHCPCHHKETSRGEGGGHIQAINRHDPMEYTDFRNGNQKHFDLVWSNKSGD